MHRLLFLLILLLSAACAPAQERLRLALPLDCRLGQDCFVQNYVDHDPSPAARDFSCGAQTYDGHNGTDFRLPSLVAQRAGVAVLAAAAGEVAAVRDGMADVSIRDSGQAAVQGRECGNGVRVRHTDGWETQYCHMAQGSIGVRQGQRVTAGQVLGRVGLSGMTEFPHLHFTVRHHGGVLDPFAPDAVAGRCGPAQSQSLPLWHEDVARLARYRHRTVLNQGFADHRLSMADVENLPAAGLTLTPDSPALVAYVRTIGLEAGDAIELLLRGPDGRILARTPSQPLERPLAQTLTAAGRQRPATGWPPGLYQAEYRIRHQGETVLEPVFSITMGR